MTVPAMTSASKKRVRAKTPPSTKTPIRNPARTRAKLLQATIDLLATKGADALSLKEAARLADVSRAVAYKHFADRDHLLREARAWISGQLLEAARDIQPIPGTEAVEKHVHRVASLVLNNREAARLLIGDALLGKALDARHPLYQMVVKDLEVFKASGLARRDFDVKILSYIMLGTISTLIMLSHLPHAGGSERLAKRFSVEWSSMLVKGLILERPRRARPSSRVR
jgi:AcrR family transcriptional regulator